MDTLKRESLTEKIINELETEISHELKKQNISSEDVDKLTYNLMHKILLYKLHYPVLNMGILNKKSYDYYKKSDNNVNRIP